MGVRRDALLTSLLTGGTLICRQLFATSPRTYLLRHPRGMPPEQKVSEVTVRGLIKVGLLDSAPLRRMWEENLKEVTLPLTRKGELEARELRLPAAAND